MRILAAATGLALLAGGATASAAPRPARACNLVVDARDDTTVYGVWVNAQPLHSPGLDIVGADVATSATHLTFVVRVVGIEDTPPTSPHGLYYRNFLTVDGVGFQVYADLGLTTPGYGMVRTEETPTPNVGSKITRNGTGRIDRARGEIAITVPLSAFADLGVTVKRGSRITEIQATSLRHLGGVVLVSDFAPTTRTYAAGTPSCIRVGP